MRLRAARDDERGATLLLVIGFIVIVALMSSAVLGLLLTGTKSRVALDQARNREYSADGAVEHAIADVRANMQTHPFTPCPSAHIPYAKGALPNGQVDMQVDCTYDPWHTLSGFLQRNVVFVACAQQGGPQCGPGIISARVNFQSDDSAVATSITVSKTFIQTWSVNE